MDTADRQLEYQINRRNLALIELDTRYMREATGIPPDKDDHFVLTVIHKVRFEVPSIPPQLRNHSRAWLIQHGHDRYGGVPWPPEGRLP